MASPVQQRFYDFDVFRVDVSRRLLMRQCEPVPLTPKAFDILLVLVQNRGRVVEKDELMKLVWPDTVVEENNLTRNISTLCKALEEGPTQHRFIVTIPGRGYQFAGDMPEDMAGTAVVYERHARTQVLIEEQSEPDMLLEPIQHIKTGIVERKRSKDYGKESDGTRTCPFSFAQPPSAAEHNLRKFWPFAPSPGHFVDCTRFLRTTARLEGKEPNLS